MSFGWPFYPANISMTKVLAHRGSELHQAFPSGLGSPSVVVLLLLFFSVFCGEIRFAIGQTPLAGSVENDREAQVDAEIQKWIANLGADSYAQRQEAQRRLEAYGVRALDRIRQATLSPDAQIASQARFLLQSNQLEWTWNNEPFETRKIIEEYKLASPSDKPNKIRELSQLSNNHGIAALCRICCYETDEVNSKFAALELLRRLEERRIPGIQSNPSLRSKLDPKTIEMLIGSASDDLADFVSKNIQGANSRACSWVRLAYSNAKEFPVDSWKGILDQEQSLLETSSPSTRLNLFVDLTTWVAQQAKRNDQGRLQAIELARRLPALLLANDPDPDKLIGFAEWALGAELPELVQEQYQQLPKQFPGAVPPILHYLLAESFAQQGKQQLASDIAKNALKRKSVAILDGKLSDEQGAEPVQLDSDKEALEFRSINFNFERTSIAQLLIKRGSFDWAEAELRESIQGQEDSPDRILMISLHTLALMLHEQDRDSDAVKVLDQWVARYESEKLFRMQVDDLQLDLPSNYYLYRANHHAKEGKEELAREDYFKSILLAADNVDALIGLAKLQENSEQKRRRIAEQEQAISSLRNEIEAIDRDLRLANPIFQPMEKKRLANSLNTLAWLMANTDTDPREALLLSRRSCALSPDQSAYQDTLAHCLAKNGKYNEAFRTQIQALTLEPHQLSLQRALVRFYELAIKDGDQGTLPK